MKRNVGITWLFINNKQKVNCEDKTSKKLEQIDETNEISNEKLLKNINNSASKKNSNRRKSAGPSRLDVNNFYYNYIYIYVLRYL